MLGFLQRRIEPFWRKNGEEIRAIARGKMPTFLSASDSTQLGKEIPVFCFHSVEPLLFEKQLRYLAANGYQSVDATTLLQMVRGRDDRFDKVVALTFDDATGSFWATAYPLLKKYGFHAIVFVIPGLVPEDDCCYSNLEDVWVGRCSIQEIIDREKQHPLCTWPELIAMQQSGLVDIQSHSLTHSRVSISPQIVDFMHPNFDTYFYENINVPITNQDPLDRPLRQQRFGQPVYKSASRMAGKRRFIEDTALSETMVLYVEENGGIDFFAHSSWRRQLGRIFENSVRKSKQAPDFESREETETAMRKEFAQAKMLLESRLPDKKISHFCYPWFQGGIRADEIAMECGYEAVYYGLEVPEVKNAAANLPQRVRRVSDEYLLCLPGKGREPLHKVWLGKLLKIVKKHKHNPAKLDSV